jgi:cyanophycinase
VGTEQEQQLGSLVIIGGAEDKEGDCLVLREFLRAAGVSMPTLLS